MFLVRAFAGMTIIVLTFSPMSHASEAFVDIPIVFSTSYTPALSTDLKAGIGIGWTHFPLEYHSLRFGYGALFSISPLFWQGTRDVYTVGLDHDLEARGYIAYAFDGSNISFLPYFYAAPSFSAKVTKIVVYASQDRVLLPDVGIRSGLGLMVRFRDYAIKIDSSAGVGLSGFNLRTSIMFSLGIF